MPDPNPNETYHEKFSDGSSITVKNTEDSKYPDGSYFVSQTEGGEKTTNIFDDNGNFIESKVNDKVVDTIDAPKT